MRLNDKILIAAAAVALLALAGAGASRAMVSPALAAALGAQALTVLALGSVVAIAQVRRGRESPPAILAAAFVFAAIATGLLLFWPHGIDASGATLALAVGVPTFLGLIGWPVTLALIGLNRREVFLISVAFAPIGALSAIVLSALLIRAFA